MAQRVRHIPEGFHTITPQLIVRNARQAIDFYKRAFGAEVLHQMPGPDGKTLMHADLKIGSSHLYLCDEFPQMGAKSPQSLGGTPITLTLYVEDADKVYNQAVTAGAEVVMPLKDQFWGDRYGMLKDPYGQTWAVASHIEDVPPAELQKRAAEACKSGGECGHN